MADDSLDGLVRLFELVDLDQNDEEKPDAEGENEKILRHLKTEVMLALDGNKPVHPLAKQIWKVEEIINRIQAQGSASCEQGLDVSDPSLIEVKYKSNDCILSEVRSMLQEFYCSENYVIEVPSRSKKHQKFDAAVEQKKLVANCFERKRSSDPNNTYLVTISLLFEIFKMCDSKKDATIRDIYYTNAALYKSTERVSSIIDDICCILRCHRECLRLFASTLHLLSGSAYFHRSFMLHKQAAIVLSYVNAFKES